MGWTIGIPSLKLNKAGVKSKHCGDFASVAGEALEERQGHDPDINPELAAKNVYEGCRSAAELLAYSDAHCSTLRDANGRGLRKDAVRMCATIVKPPAAMMAELSEEEQIRFLDDSLDKIREIVGPGNVKAVAKHFDEQGPHVHVFWEPMTEDGRLCAKELHNLQFFNRLNKEMPEHLRSRGWDIDDCNAYDAAKEQLLTEKEKAERRQKNGRSSAVYKAEAERQLNTINHEIDRVMLNLESNLQDYSHGIVEDVANSQGNVYENAMFLMMSCSDERFAELDQEGQELRRRLLQEAADQSRNAADLQALIEQATPRTLSWQERQEMWDIYKSVSDDFWQLRSELKADFQYRLDRAYSQRSDAMRHYYDAMYMLRRSRSILGVLFFAICALVAMARKDQLNDQIDELKTEQRILVQNTASFNKFSKAYRNNLKAGKMPGEEYLEAMTTVVERLDQEERKFRVQLQHRHRPNEISFPR